MTASQDSESGHAAVVAETEIIGLATTIAGEALTAAEDPEGFVVR